MLCAIQVRGQNSPQKRHGPEKSEGQEHDESFFHSVIVITRGNLDIQNNCGLERKPVTTVNISSKLLEYYTRIRFVVYPAVETIEK